MTEDIIHQNDIQLLPIKSEDNFIRGSFDYIKHSFTREMLINGYKAIDSLNLWDYMKKDVESYTWSNDKEIDFISDKMVELGYKGHSGFSFGFTMRALQYIAIHGEEKYMKKYFEEKEK